MNRILVLVLSVAFMLPLDTTLTSEAKAAPTPTGIQAGNGDDVQLVAKGKKGKKGGKKGKKGGKKGKKGGKKGKKGGISV